MSRLDEIAAELVKATDDLFRSAIETQNAIAREIQRRDTVKRLQKAFDAKLEEVRKSAPTGTAWAESNGSLPDTQEAQP